MSTLKLDLIFDASTFVSGLRDARWAMTKFIVSYYWPDKLPPATSSTARRI